MLNNKQIKLLALLDEQITNCKDCNLWTGGNCKPYWTPNSIYGIIGEAPGKEEVNDEPFVGRAGKLLWKIMNRTGLKKENFIIINSVNCRPVNERDGNGKPTMEECDTCFPFIRKYLKIIKPKKILLLGNYAIGSLTGEYSGVMKKNCYTYFSKNFDCNVVMSIHPSICIYKGQVGESMLYNSIKKFRGIKWTKK